MVEIIALLNKLNVVVYANIPRMRLFVVGRDVSYGGDEHNFACRLEECDPTDNSVL